MANQRSAKAKRAIDPRDHFSHGALWTVAGAYLPGLGLIKGGRRTVGGAIALGLFLGVVVILTAWAFIDLTGLIKATLNTAVLKVLVVLLPLLAIGWLTVIVASHLDLRPSRLTQSERIAGSVLVGFLSFTVAAPMAVAARYSFDQTRFVETVFRHGNKIRSGTAPKLAGGDPWKTRPRVNFLLLGGDSGPDRTGTRTDTVIVASVDTKTGNTVLISLPRNTSHMPFPAASPLHQFYPNGFTDGDPDNEEYFVNEIYENVPPHVPADILGPTDNLGADALKLSVGEALGLKIDYYALINLEGFNKLVTALGGITVNINTWVPMGGNTEQGIKPSKWISPGPNKHLNGTEALWYARGRYGSDDFQRMDRQRCVVNAIVKQANPANMLTRYEDIARTGKDMVSTDMPQEILPAVVDLSNRVKNGKTRSIVFKHGADGFSSTHPDFNLVRQRVSSGISEAAKPSLPPVAPSAAPQAAQPSSAPASSPARTTPSSAPSSSASSGTTPTVGASPVPIPQSEDLQYSCEFKPEIAAAQPTQPPS